jgi:hypothetical protein
LHTFSWQRDDEKSFNSRNEEEKPVDPADIERNYPAIRAAANDVLGLFGPEFSGRPEGHVETDIAAAASLAGLSILRAKGFDLREFKPGSVLLSDLDTEMSGIWDFMMAAAANMGLDPQGGWENEIPESNKPVLTIGEMTQKTEKGFLAVCSRHQLAKEYLPYVAALAAIKLVFAADKMGILDKDIGKALTGYHVVAGAKTVPFPAERE